MTGPEIRQRFLEHFERREHLILDSASLVPVDDPSTLFISAGMQPLQPYYKGLRPAPAARLASCQKCFRTVDLDEVGKDDRHSTMFEMMGNFAPTGDYFKERAIPWAWELVTQGFGIPVERLRVTIHPSDDEAFQIWTGGVGVRADWVYRDEGNWWGLAIGPCGPDSELYYDRGPDVGCGLPDCRPDHCDRFLEIWNLVFPQFDKQPDGSLTPLPRPAIDTGMGLERIACALQGVPNPFETDLYRPVMVFIRENSGERQAASERVVADHLRAMSFVISAGVLPGKEGRGYVLRRLIRRALLHAGRLRLGRPLSEGVGAVTSALGDQYPELVTNRDNIEHVVEEEAHRFSRTLEQGMELFDQVASRHGSAIPGSEAFRLHDTFGFPLELTRELAVERGLQLDETGFATAMAEQRTRSRRSTGQRRPEPGSLPGTQFTGYDELETESEVLALRRSGTEVREVTEGDDVEVYLDRSPFYAEAGGQIGDTGVLTGPQGEVEVDDTQRPYEGAVAHIGRVRVGRLRAGERVRAQVDRPRRRQIMRHHSATHLLNKALEEVLDRRNLQRGSWVGPEHTTFDFPLERPLSPEELQRIGGRINEQVRAALPLRAEVLPYEAAVGTGATHLFDEKYGDRVRVVCFGDWTCEFCGGTHVANTADVGPALVVSESSIGQGLRRLDLTVGEAAEDLVRRRLGLLGEVARGLGVPPEQVGARVAELRRELKDGQRQLARVQEELRTATLRGASNGPRRRPGRVPLVIERVPAESLDDLRGWADRYLENLGGSGIVVVSDGTSFVVKVSRDMAAEHAATSLVPMLGQGGGRPEMAQGRLTKVVGDAFQEVENALA